MKMVVLDKRLQAVAEFVRMGKSVCDIGTDHALLPCYLKQQGFRCVFASDINDGPLLMAKKTMAEYGVSGITLIKSDGLVSVPPCDDVVIAGMGGELISTVIDNCDWINKDTRLILQPMTKHEVLRRYLYANGYEILEEKCIADSYKVYTVIYACYTGINTTITELFAYVGKNSDKNYLGKVYKKLLNMANKDCKYLEIAQDIKKQLSNI